jgi:hypothetical protein
MSSRPKVKPISERTELINGWQVTVRVYPPKPQPEQNTMVTRNDAGLPFQGFRRSKVRRIGP